MINDVNTKDCSTTALGCVPGRRAEVYQYPARWTFTSKKCAPTQGKYCSNRSETRREYCARVAAYIRSLDLKATSSRASESATHHTS